MRTGRREDPVDVTVVRVGDEQAAPIVEDHVVETERQGRHGGHGAGLDVDADDGSLSEAGIQVPASVELDRRGVAAQVARHDGDGLGGDVDAHDLAESRPRGVEHAIRTEVEAVELVGVACGTRSAQDHGRRLHQGRIHLVQAVALEGLRDEQAARVVERDRVVEGGHGLLREVAVGGDAAHGAAHDVGVVDRAVGPDGHVVRCPELDAVDDGPIPLQDLAGRPVHRGDLLAPHARDEETPTLVDREAVRTLDRRTPHEDLLQRRRRRRGHATGRDDRRHGEHHDQRRGTPDGQEATHSLLLGARLPPPTGSAPCASGWDRASRPPARLTPSPSAVSGTSAVGQVPGRLPTRPLLDGGGTQMTALDDNGPHAPY